TIVTAPAIQVLELTRKQRERQGNSRGQFLPSPTPNQQSAPSTLIVGNPTMPSVSTAPGEPPEPLPPLPESEKEAIAIAQLLGTQALTGNQATKVSVLKKLPAARLVHFATHGLLEYGSQSASLEGLGVPGAIALAPSNADDGLLTTSEVLNLRLTADLVTLSACDTGQGRITGDGVIGLSRAFIAAGVPSVIVSLWAVPDAATAKLMTTFYQTLQQQPDKAQALRQAMLITIKDYPDPVDWAAFTLIGEAG
ncbi:MAG TPA: CHAT domain-containing protein, partial [Candidatus Sericytochromatia bacterium]